MEKITDSLSTSLFYRNPTPDLGSAQPVINWYSRLLPRGKAATQRIYCRGQKQVELYRHSTHVFMVCTGTLPVLHQTWSRGAHSRNVENTKAYNFSFVKRA